MIVLPMNQLFTCPWISQSTLITEHRCGQQLDNSDNWGFLLRVVSYSEFFCTELFLFLKILLFMQCDAAISHKAEQLAGSPKELDCFRLLRAGCPKWWEFKSLHKSLRTAKALNSGLSDAKALNNGSYRYSPVDTYLSYKGYGQTSVCQPTMSPK